MIDISSSIQAYQTLREQVNPYAEEVWLLALNTQLRLIRQDLVFRGTVDHCPLHPRDIFRILILANASSFVLAHNHPSNDISPSSVDLDQTRKLLALAELFEIQLLDHLIITSANYYSMGDHGLIKKWRQSFRRKKIGLTDWSCWNP